MRVSKSVFDARAGACGDVGMCVKRTAGAALLALMACIASACADTNFSFPWTKLSNMTSGSAVPASTSKAGYASAQADYDAKAAAAAKAAPASTTSQGYGQPPPPPRPTAQPEPLPPPTGTQVDGVVASVDGDPITMHEVSQFAQMTGNPIASGDPSTSPTGKAALKAMIGQKLLEQEVKKYQDKVDEPQVDKYIDTLRKDKHLSDAQFRAQLQASGMTYDELRNRARLELEKAMMIQQEVRDKINVTPAEIQVYYDAHKSDYTIEKERLKLAQVLIAIPANATPQQIAEAQKKAEQVRARAMKGTDFNDLAHAYSDDDSKSNGGELGWFAPGDVNDQILAGVKDLKPGQVSQVIRTKYGFHVVKLEEHESPGVRPLVEVKDQIRNKLIDEQISSRLQNWVETDLIKQHYVETIY